MRWEKSMKSWTVNPLPEDHKEAPGVHTRNSSWKKLRLLLWKNYTIQMRHKWQTFIEILIPIMFTTVLVITRVFIQGNNFPEVTEYPPLPVNLPPYSTIWKAEEIYYAPRNNLTDHIMQTVHQKYFYDEGFEYNLTGFDTEAELLEAYRKNAGSVESETDLVDIFLSSSPVFAAVVFDGEIAKGEFPKELKYALRFPASLRGSYDIIEEQTGLKAAWFAEILYPLAQLLGPRARNKTDGGLPGYNEEGFLYLQNAVDETFTKMVYNSSEEDLERIGKYNKKFQRFPHIPYTFDLYIFGMQGFLPMLMLMSFIYPVINITKSIVHEKERRLKESMKMMGLSNWLHWVAWFIKSYVFLFVSCIVITILLKTNFSEDKSLIILPKSNGWVLLWIYSIFSFSTVCFCFLVSVFFSKSNPAATGAGALWILFYTPYAFLQPRYNLLPFWVKLSACFGSNIPISMGCQIIALFEGSGEGLQWHNLGSGSSPDDNFTILWAVAMMVINGIIHLLLALYIEAVWPGEYGIPLPYNFFLKKWYWKGSPRDEFDFDFGTSTPTKNYNVESASRNLVPGIQIKNLTKRFGKKMAVNNFSLDIYEGQITALLGHNGAGKTTTISMLTGLFPPTSGTATISGFDIHRDMASIRNSLGICPQHNVLFDELTVAEHLEFFCLLKGMEKHLVDPEINRLLAAVGLESKRHAKSRTLSGGMKRKLSVLIALCGGSKIVLLDECTSGMDSGARRNTWDLIQSEKHGRTVILSTHFMEEADVLGDRIAIMADGELQCCGSSLFLKKRYGGGYNLVIVKTPECVVENITNLLKSSIPDTEMEQNVGAELSYILPDSQSHLFPAIFEELETKREELGIASYGASITTMEEVFMKVLRKAESSKSSSSREDLDIVKDMADHGHHVEINHMDMALLEDSLLFSKKQLTRNSGLNRLVQQLWSMVLKKLLHVVRNKYLVLFQVFLPLLYLNLAFFALRAFPGFRTPIPLEVSTLKRYESVGRTTTLLNCLNQSLSLCDDYASHVGERFEYELLNDERVADRILREEEKNLVYVNYKYIVAYEERPGQKEGTLDLVAYFNNQPYHGPPVALNFVSNAILKKSNHTIQTFNQPLPYSKLDSIKETGSVLTLGFQVGYNMAIALSFLVAAFVVFLVKERVSGAKHLQTVSGVKIWLYWLSHFIVDYSTFMVTAVTLLLALNVNQIEEFMDFEVQKHFLLLMMAFGFAILPFTYLLSFLGSNPTTAFSRLVIFYCYIGLAPMMTMVFFSLPIFYLEHLVDTFNRYFMISPNYAIGQGVMQLSVNYHLKGFCGGIAFLEDICAATNERFCCQMLKQDYLDWERMGIGRNVFHLFAAGCIFILWLFAVEYKVFKSIADLFRKPESVLDDNVSDVQDPVGIEDSDVLREEDKIRKTELQTLFKEERLVVRDLTKVFNKFVAVDHLNFAVKPGECFGLLGVNGAGKTTTFKQLTGDIPASHGDAFICGKSVMTELSAVHECIGYTPQFDGLIDELSGRETIRMFARLKGIPEQHIEGLINELGQVLLFSQHLDKWSCKLSGGNKRKLSTACALVGKPGVVLLDEPSSGMDPVARRHLWNAISMIRDAGTSCVLTTHSLEEAEALCTRMGIMVNGRFRCMGSPQHLKNKFSKGYTLIAQTRMKMLEELNEPFTRSMEEKGRRRSSIRTPRGSFIGKRSPLHWEASLQELRAFIEDAFPDCMLKDIHPGFVHYHIAPNEQVSWGKMFAIMEEARAKYDLEAYSVGQTSLEQVFLNFTKTQINE